MSWSVHDAVILEKLGIPVATTCSDEFFALGKAEAKCPDMSGLPITVVPHPVAKLPAGDVARIADDAVADIINLPEHLSDKSWTWSIIPSLPGATRWRSKPNARHSQLIAAGVSRYRSDGTMVVVVLFVDVVMGIYVLLHSECSWKRWSCCSNRIRRARTTPSTFCNCCRSQPHHQGGSRSSATVGMAYLNPRT